MRKLFCVLTALMIAFTTSVIALEDFVLETYESYAVGTLATFGSGVAYPAFVSGPEPYIVTDGSNKYLSIDATSVGFPAFFGIGQQTNFVYPLDMTEATISFDINVSGLSAEVEAHITAQIFAYYWNGANYVQTQAAFGLASPLALGNTGGWDTMEFDVADLTSGESQYWVPESSLVWKIGILVTDIEDATGIISFDNIKVSGVTVIPEPASIILLLGAVAGMVIKKRK
ncbi:MAG: PEP-CTERM sorting domain-containing protein [Candidatus Auribacterota bacterium]|jgi:hypothetical protein|nr:PEP-CTERM sorting domain-containing protein [Candidatus Auribacterota bacterium]